MRIRPFSDRDVEAVLALNEESVWALSPLDEPGLTLLRDEAACTLVSELGDEVAGFAVAYAPRASYGSINYAWHSERFDDFLYLDRIAVSKAHRRQGIATGLYDEIEQRASPHSRMVCEVNYDPPNLESLAFHTHRGYREIGHLLQLNGHVTVMLEKPL
ncbi:MAG: GNAT family N-acetyltransferase [Nocardioidaceae bacterium]